MSRSQRCAGSVLATAGEDGPLATPVRYYHREMTIYFTCQAGTPKLRNIEAEPRVSVGLFAPLVGQASSRGAQLFGLAQIGGGDLEVIHWEPFGTSSDVRPGGKAPVTMAGSPLDRLLRLTG